ncbi:unnamed protein product [Prorocentrum cordatum]|uniref:ShKT domain-containing protein n=1 Tax=Prorocentrum cordatum TaxID=2364126 RepID=A0ABN9U955_9DINO|nr:unnamed protein product [Polarella glacialis]
MSTLRPVWQRIQTCGNVMALLLLVAVTGAIESERLVVGLVVGVAFVGCTAAHLVQSKQWAELCIGILIMLVAIIAILRAVSATRRFQQLLYQHREHVANTINQAMNWSAAHANLDVEQLGPAPLNVDCAPRQQCSDLRTLYVQARQCIPELNRIATHIRSAVGGLHAAEGPGFSIRLLPLPEARSRIKVDHGCRVPDLVGLLSCTFDCCNIQEASACARALIACQQPMDIEVKRLDNGFRGAELSGGDRTILTTCSLGGGFLCTFSIRSADTALPEEAKAEVWVLARRAGLLGISPLRLGSYVRTPRQVHVGIGMLRVVSAAASLFLAISYFLEYSGESLVKGLSLPLPHLTTACMVLLDTWDRSVCERSGRRRSRVSHFYQRVLGVGGKFFLPRVVVVQTSGMLLQAVGKLSLLGAMVTTLRMQPPRNSPPRPSVDLSSGFWALLLTLVAHAFFVGIYVGSSARPTSAARQTIIGMLGPLLLQVSYILSYGTCAFLVIRQTDILPASITQDENRAVADLFFTDTVVGGHARPDKTFAFPDLSRPVAFFALALPAAGLMLTTRAVEERLAFLGPGALARFAPPLGRASRTRLRDRGPMLTRPSGPSGSPAVHARTASTRRRCVVVAGALVPLVSLVLLGAILAVGNSDRFPLETTPSCFPCWCSAEGELRSCGVAVDMRYRVLSLEQAGIARIRPGAFSPSAFVSSPNLISEASFRGNVLEALEAGTFQHMPQITWLDLRDNTLEVIAPGAFEGLERARDLLLDLSPNISVSIRRCGGYGCRLPALKAGAFRGLPRLRTLGLGLSGATGTGVPSMEPGAFSGLDSLEVLRLDSAECFDASGRLLPGLFDGLGQLRVLVLSGTRVSQMGPGDFAGTPRLRLLDVSSRRSSEPGGLEVQPGTFQGLAQLRFLDLSYVGMEDLQPGALAGLSELRHLGLSQNSLRRLRAGVLQGLGNLEELDLSGNNITEVEPAAFDGLRSPPLQSLSLRGAPLHSSALACTEAVVCRDSFIALWRLARAFVTNIFVDGLGCSEARHLCGQDASQTLTLIDPACPETCGTCGAFAADDSQADSCADKDWVLVYGSALAAGVELPPGAPGAPGTARPLATWSTCADVVASGACEHPFWHEAVSLICPVTCDKCGVSKDRPCADVSFFTDTLGYNACQDDLFVTLCGNDGALGDLVRLICPSSCGECTNATEGCEGTTVGLTLGEVLELLNAGAATHGP